MNVIADAKQYEMRIKLSTVSINDTTQVIFVIRLIGRKRYILELPRTPYKEEIQIIVCRKIHW